MLEMLTAVRQCSGYNPRSCTRYFDPDQMYPNPSCNELKQDIAYHRSVLLSTAAATHNEDQPDLLRLLLENGARIHEWHVDGNTCLHLLITAARPDQPWCHRSLVTLIQAGADPNQSNHCGYTAFDLVCSISSKFGSFRRDLLLHALLESRSDIQDERLLAPTEFTASYTSSHHAMISGVSSPEMAYIFRTTLLNRTANAIECRNIKLHEASVDRVLSSHAPAYILREDSIFLEVLDYLQRMEGGNKQLVRMARARLSHETWTRFSQNLDWLQMTSQAQIAALLEFDWFRPVDPEDVFLSYVDFLIEQLDDLRPNEPNSRNIDRLIEALENAIPSYRAVSVKKRASETPSFCSGLILWDKGNAMTVTCKETLTLCIPSDADRAVGQAVEERERQESLVKTPIEYYGPELKAVESCASTETAISKPSDEVEKSFASATKRKKWRWSTKRRRS